MKELQDILETYATCQKEGRQCAIATVVKTRGSVYRRVGARMLLTEAGKTIGAISGGCLEGDIFDRALPLLLDGGKSFVVRYDTTATDDLSFGLGLGCNGVVDVLIELLDDSPTERPRQRGARQLEFIKTCLQGERGGIIATVFAREGVAEVELGDRLFLYPNGEIECAIAFEPLRTKMAIDARQAWEGERTFTQSYYFEQGEIEVLFEYIPPVLSLLLFGAGYDALPVVSIAKQLGWQVTVIDSRYGYPTRDRFPLADRLIFGQPEEWRDRLSFHPRTVAVILTHQYDLDLQILQILLSSSLPYIGLLGPKTRTQQLLQDLRDRGFSPTAAQLQRLHAPIGLDIGANSPEEIALAIAAEIQAAIEHRKGGFLRERKGSIHEE